VVPYEAEAISYSNGALKGRSDGCHLPGILQAIHVFDKSRQIDRTTHNSSTAYVAPYCYGRVRIRRRSVIYLQDLAMLHELSACLEFFYELKIGPHVTVDNAPADAAPEV